MERPAGEPRAPVRTHHKAGDNMRGESSQGESGASRRPVRQRFVVIALTALVLASCQRRGELTAQRAEGMLREYMFAAEPVYAEVPRKVWFGPSSPMDDFDQRSLKTFRNLQAAGLITVTESHDPDGTSIYIATVTTKGFPILGTDPSLRGPVHRGKICEKKYDGLRNFLPHPTDPAVGNAELVWHYENPTPLYPLFETKINKPLKKPFISLVSFFYKDHEWKFDVTVRKAEAS